MSNSIITSLEKNFIYVSNKVEIVAKQALILLAKTISKLVFRIQFFFTDHQEKKELITHVSGKLGNEISSLIILATPQSKLKNLGLEIIDDFYDCASNERSVSKAFQGTWDILKIDLE